MSYALLTKNTRVNFQIYPNGLLNVSFTNVLIASEMSYEDAKDFSDVDARHEVIYTSLPANSASANPRELNYLSIRNAQGEREIIAREWIVPSSIEVVGNSNASVPLLNVKPADRDRIRTVLIGAGFTVGEIVFTTP